MIGVQMSGKEYVLEDEPLEHKKWLVDAKPTIEWKFWKRYRDYLIKEKFWNDNLIDALDNTSDKILDLMGDPRSDKPFASLVNVIVMFAIMFLRGFDGTIAVAYQAPPVFEQRLNEGWTLGTAKLIYQRGKWFFGYTCVNQD